MMNIAILREVRRYNSLIDLPNLGDIAAHFMQAA
jgi:hypothetical protein